MGRGEDLGQEDLPEPAKPHEAGLASVMAGEVDSSVAGWGGLGRVPPFCREGPV